MSRVDADQTPEPSATESVSEPTTVSANESAKGSATELTPPEPQVGPRPRIGTVGMLRWAWRQLTSMRTALFLLLLVAVGALPGSIWPQRGVDATRVNQYLEEYPQLGPWLDRFGMFDVYTSAWFSAIYLLLLLSLIGCIVPRTRMHWHTLRAAPPRAPRRLDRLPVCAQETLPGPITEVESAFRQVLRRRRYRLRAGDEPGVISAECGYLRETGNLVFHVAILVLIVALAWGHLVGWRADRIVPVGESFSNTVRDYDTFTPGPRVNPDALQPFTVRVDGLQVRFEQNAGGAQFGAARDFRASTTVWDRPGAAPVGRELSVNGPLDFGGASVYLLGNGYAPRITVRDRVGRVLYSQATPFLPQDERYRSVGAVKVTGGAPNQLGFSGLFLPTAYLSTDGPASAFPDLHRPALVLTVFEGRLFESGRAQSVYTLDTTAMRQLTDASGRPVRIWLEPGRTVTLPGGRGSITLDGVDRWAGVSTRYDPAKPLALVSALLALAGLVASLLVRRRRVFVRLHSQDSSAHPGLGHTRVSVGALGRGEDPMLEGEIRRMLQRVRGTLQSTHDDGDGGHNGTDSGPVVNPSTYPGRQQNLSG